MIPSLEGPLVSQLQGAEGGEQVAKNTGKVLIIDDDLDFANCARLALERRGHAVLVANGGVEGVETAKRERPDVVIVDLLMVPDDGFTICEALRGLQETQRSAILIVSAIGRKLHKTFASPEVGARLDVDGFMDKPVQLDALARTVEEMLRLARSRAGETEENT